MSALERDESPAPESEPVTALGLMSGTSLDGVDAALLRTDGEDRVECGPALTVAYAPELRERLRALLAPPAGADEREVAAVSEAITRAHAQAVDRLLDEAGAGPAEVAVIGFHGHTILHRPAEGETRQIGDGDLLAELTGIDVVDDFRSEDVAAGGEGAPLAPLYHAALARAAGLERPLAIVNIGGVANVTWIGAEGTRPELIAFDTGPGNALLDDWVRARTGEEFDRDGRLAAAGRVDTRVLRRLLDSPYFAHPPPKSLDRGDFALTALAGMAPADGAATLTAFTAEAVALAARHFPAPPRRWLITGGGRRNAAVMAALEARVDGEVAPVESVGWDGDALEAQAFAYLAVRSLRGLNLTLPTTTGARAPSGGGRLHRAAVR